MDITSISLRSSKQFPDIVCDYQENDPFLAPFYQFRPDISSYGAAIEKRANFSTVTREILVNTLLKQYHDAGISFSGFEKVKENIDLLRSEKTFTVTTGHQLCLLTGPLYFHFKILTTIKLALSLKKAYPGYHFVPVFWMASEDHDFAEINHVNIFNKRFTWELESKDQPVGRLGLESLQPLLSEIESLARNEASAKVVSRYTEAYKNSKNLAEATLKLAHTLFGEEGLVVIEPDKKEWKELFKSTIKEDIVHRKNVELLKATNELLKQRYKPQVNGREINFFYLAKNGRKLLKWENGLYKTADETVVFTKDEMEKEIENHPEKFSPNVVMRPVYQETILPNLSYIGGPGELAYWLQLKGVFEENKTFFPVLQLRETYVLLGAGLAGKIAKSGLETVTFLQTEEEITNRFLERQAEDTSGRLITDIINTYQALIDSVGADDNISRTELIKLKTEQAKILSKISTQIKNNRKEKSAADIQKLMKIREVLLPNGSLAERWDNILSYELNAGSYLKTHILGLEWSQALSLQVAVLPQ